MGASAPSREQGQHPACLHPRDGRAGSVLCFFTFADKTEGVLQRLNLE